ncbi:arginase family protein [Peribacillus muralis]|uniref:arginase family protein n=1 Tax=Peribacillus muralis TaxID=264697 RepID=UPI003CFF945D
MNILLSPQTELDENTLTEKNYGNSITISDGVASLIEDIKKGKTLNELKEEYPEDALLSIVNELIEQGFLTKENFSVFQTIHPVHCTNLSQETFFGSVLGNLGYDISDSVSDGFKRMGILGVPYNMGSVNHSIPYESHSALRKYSSSIFSFEQDQDGRTKAWYSPSYNKYVGDGLVVKDYGDLEVSINQELQLNRIEQLSARITSEGITPFFIGGDHAVSYSIVKGLLDVHEEIQIIQLDAHSDLGINRWDIVEHGSFMHYLLQEDKVKRVFQFGIRGPQAVKYVNDKLQIAYGKNYKGKDVDTAIPTYVSVDVDVFDPSIVPSVGYPVPNGWLYEDFLNFIKEYVPTLNIIGFDLVEYNVMYDNGNKVGASTVAHAIIDLLEGVAEKHEQDSEY